MTHIRSTLALLLIRIAKRLTVWGETYDALSDAETHEYWFRNYIND